MRHKLSASPLVRILGIPTDSHSSFLRGAALAPAFVRSELFSESGNPYTEFGIDLSDRAAFADAGDVAIEENEGDLARIDSAVSEELRNGSRILSIDGDHFVTYPIVRAYARIFGQLTIVHFDAHPDLYSSFQGDRYSHASPFARILEDLPAIKIVQIGIRSTSPEQSSMSQRYDVRVFRPSEIGEARKALPQGNVYVTVDCDALDPSCAPGVSHREPGGLGVREVLDLIHAIPGDVVGADVVEYNPAQDISRLTAQVAAKLVRELAAKMLTPVRQG